MGDSHYSDYDNQESIIDLTGAGSKKRRLRRLVRNESEDDQQQQPQYSDDAEETQFDSYKRPVKLSVSTPLSGELLIISF